MLSSPHIDDTLSHCAVCRCNEFEFLFQADFGSIGRCCNCGQVLRTDEPERDRQVILHQSSELHLSPYALLSESATDELAFYSGLLDLCQNATSPCKILDVGCGAGEFLKHAADRGFETVGIEPIAELRMLAEQKIGKHCVTSSSVESSDFEDESFDAIALWDVIEHLVDPRGVLERLHRILKPGGHLGIATLNHDSLMYAIYHLLRRCAPPIAKPFGAMLYNPFHTYYFTKKSLSCLVENAGFEVSEHRGYEFPIRRLDVSVALKVGMRGLYVLQKLCGAEGEQYLFARKRCRTLSE